MSTKCYHFDSVKMVMARKVFVYTKKKNEGKNQANCGNKKTVAYTERQERAKS